MPSPTQRDYWNGEVGRIWTEQQTRLDDMLAPMTGPALEAFRPGAGAAVLDVGCGAGATTMALARRGCAPLGVDISAPLLELARRRAGEAGLDLRFVEADAGAATLPGAPFEGLFSRFGVMFFEAPQAAFAHLHSQMKPEAPLAFLCWRGPAENPWNVLPAQVAQELIDAPLPKADPLGPGPFAFADAARTTEILRGAGWRNVEAKGWKGRIPLGASTADAAALLTQMAHARLIAPYGLDAAAVEARIGAALGDMAGPDGAVTAPAACWIVTARA